MKGGNGGQFCNLVTMNASNIQDEQDFIDRCRAAAVIATLQAGYTDFHYLGKGWKETTEEEALIGVSITGIASGKLDNVDLSYGAEIVKAVNAEVADRIGIEQAARVNTVKPEGCLDPSTKLKTSKGDISLSDIFTLNGYDYKELDVEAFYDVNADVYVKDKDNKDKKITSLYVSKVQETYMRIEMNDSTIVECTPWHRFMTVDGEWIRADELTTEHDLKTY